MVKFGEEKREKDQFSIILGKFIIVRLCENREAKYKDSNDLLGWCYTLFSLSGVQTQLMQKWAYTLIDPTVKLPDLSPDNPVTYSERIIFELSNILLNID